MIDVAVTHTSSPFVSAYPWSAAGFGVKYANPAVLPPSISGVAGLSFSPSDTALLLTTRASSPFVAAYAWTLGVGFGAKYANPSVLSVATRGLAVSRDGASVAVACNAAPWIAAWPWSTGGGFGAKYSNPATAPTDISAFFGARDVAFTPNASTIFLCYGVSLAIPPHVPTLPVAAYPWGPGFGAKYADATYSPETQDTTGIDCPTDAAVITVGGAGTSDTGLPAYAFSGGFGARYPIAPSGGGSFADVASGPAGNLVLVGDDSTHIVAAYPWGPGFGAQFRGPGPGPLNVVRVALAPDSSAAAAAVTGSPAIVAYPFAAGFGAQYANPAVLPGGGGAAVAFTGQGAAPPSPGQPDACGPKNLTPKPLSLIDPEPVVRTYPHVTEIGDWAAQQSIKLLWDRLHDHESRLRAGVANDQQWVTAANASADAARAAQLTADHALAQAGAGAAASDGGTGGGESGGDGGSPDDPEAGDGFNNRFATGHPPALPVPLTSYTVGQIVGGVANEFPALFANYPSDAETVAACQEYVLRTIWHLQQAGFTAGRQRNPSLLISNDKITVFVDGTYRAYDIASLGGAGSPNVPHIIRVSPADYVADAGTPD